MKSKEQSGKKLFFKTLLKFLLIFGIAAVVLIGVLFFISTTGKNAIDYKTLNLNLSSVIYYKDKDGSYKEYEQIIGEQNRIWADIEDMPDYLPKAFVAIEDERFYKHKGVDIPRTVKATFNYIFRHDSSYGGSTIDQQLVKNITGESERTPLRKITEIFRAINLDRKLEKDEILELYANTVYFSQGCYGVQTASQKYYGKDVSELSLAEAASIAGITQAPTRYDPILNPENNKAKQELVLEKMLNLGYIDQNQFNEAVNEELNIQDNEIENVSTESYFTDRVIDELIPLLSEKLSVSETIASKMIYGGGLKIYSTVDPEIQNSIDSVYKHPENYLHYDIADPIQSAMVVMDPYTGEVKGLSGGFGEKGKRTLNRATQTLRQPGSSIKPISVYGPGFNEKLFSPATVYVDKAITVKNGDGTDHTFKNYYSGYWGPVTVRYAVQQSINTVAVECLQKLTVEKSFDYVKNKFNISSLQNSDKGLSPLALGGLTHGASVMDMTGAYSVFTNGGIYTSPHSIVKVLDNNNKVIFEYIPKTNIAISKEAASTTVSVLKSVVQSGTGVAAYLPNGIVSGGKTGTTDSDNDRWYMSISPYYTCGIWVGYDTPKTITGYYTNPAITLFNAVMRPIYQKLPYKDFDLGDTMTEIYNSTPVSSTVTICQDSGLLATSGCTNVSTVSRASAPTIYCTLHSADSTPDEPNEAVDYTPHSQEPNETRDDNPPPAPEPHGETGE